MMEPSNCGAGRHHSQIDEDGDTVCTRCRRVLRVGPLGLNGYVYGERIGFVSALAVADEGVYQTDAPPPFEDCAFTMDGLKVLAMVSADMMRKKRSNSKHPWRKQDAAWLREGSIA